MATADQPKTQTGDPSGSDETGALLLPDIAERVFHSLPIGVIVFDTALRVVSRNPAAESLVPAGEHVGEVLQQVTVEGRYEDWAAQLTRVLDTAQKARFDNINCRASDGQDRLVNMACVPLTDQTDGRVLGGMLALEDVTQQATIERRLAVSERLAAVGKLAARVAHELNNPLDGILRYINMGIRVTEQDQDERVVRYLSKARKGLMRMTQIIRELLEFSRATHPAFEQTTVNHLVEEAVKALSDEARAGGVTLALSLEDQMPPLRAGNLFQVYCNLIKNAIDAMPDGGTLMIATKLAGQCVVVRFEDTGVGLPPEADRIFEPFFTTKEQGKGTGLGLAVSRDIVERYNGQLTARNRLGGGAIFETRIPLSSCAASEGRGL